MTAVALAGALVLGACSEADEGSVPTTTERTTTTRATTTTFEPAVAGLLTPPDGVSQEQADGFAAGLVVALDDAGWPAMDRQASIDALQGALDNGAQACRVIDVADGLDAAVLVGDPLTAAGDRWSDYLVSTGMGEVEADALIGGYVRGTFEATAEHLCPEHAAVLAEAAER